MILLWREDTSSDVWTFGQLTNYLALGELGLRVNLCVPAPRTFPPSTVEIETEGEPSIFFLAGLVFVLSVPLRKLLIEFKVNVEFFELNVTHKDTAYTTCKYYFANILDQIRCFDYDKSQYKGTPFGVTGIDKLVL